MKRLPIQNLIKAKPAPKLTPSLETAFRKEAQQMVETYIVTDTIRSYFERIFDNVARGYGQGFWIQAEYGAGKTHFLVTLASLLSHSQNQGFWDSLQDEELRQYRRRLSGSKLFPVVLSLRGEGASDPYIGRSLLDVVLEGFQNALETAGLSEQIRVTAAQDILAWLDNTSQAIRDEAAAFVQKKTGQNIQAYRENEGDNALARQLAEYFKSASIDPKIASSVRERLTYIFQQLTQPGGPGYNGLLIVIDEYEGWEKGHSTPEELGRDADILETLSFILPRDVGLPIFTIVASQSRIPSKLQGGSEGDRFVPLPLLAQDSQRDYDVIIARRTRDLISDRLPEIRDHYRYYADHYEFARPLSEAEFRDVFPFQPRCFEIIRRITARELPTARSGLLVFWEVLNAAPLTARSELIRPADMLQSHHLLQECLTKNIYADAHASFLNAQAALEMLKFESDEMALAQDLLATLYLWHAAYQEQPHTLKLEELVEATLTTPTSDGLRAIDSVHLVLDQLKALAQVDFENNAASFIPTGSDGLSVLSLFEQHKQHALRTPPKLQSAVAESLFFTPDTAGGAVGLFSKFKQDERVTQRVESRRMEYSGELIVTDSWRLDHGMELPKADTHFRIIILTPYAAQNIQPGMLQDPRIAVILPGGLSDEISQAAAGYLAWKQLKEEYRDKIGRQADEVRSWLEMQRNRVYGDLISTHIKLYQSGQIITRDNLAIPARDTFGQGGDNENRIAYLVEALLTAAYPNLPIDPNRLQRSALNSTDVGKIFDGYFDKSAKTAEINATRNYGVGLGLSHPDKPGQFAPQDVPAYHLIEALLNDYKGSDVPVWKIYERLSQPPYGLPYTVIQLFLLTFIRHHSPRLDLTLKPRHGLRTHSGQPLAQDRLTSSSVADIEWKPGLEDKFDALVPGIGPSWNDLLPYARLLDEKLHQSTDQAEIEAQSNRLTEAMLRLQKDLSDLKGQLDSLAQTLQDSLPNPAKDALSRLSNFTNAGASDLLEFHHQVEEIYESQPETLRADIESYDNLRDLGANAAEIITAYTYLKQTQPPFTSRELSSAYSNLCNQLTLDLLTQGTGLWPRLESDFKHFKELYRNEYQKSHRDFYNEITRLSEAMVNAQQMLIALELLNSVRAIGKPVGDDLPDRYQVLEKHLRSCTVTEVSAVNVEYEPTCQKCNLPISAKPPREEVKTFNDDLSFALESKRRQLVNETIGNIFREGQRADLTEWFAAVQAADLSALVQGMDAETANFIKQGLERQGIYTFESDVLAELTRRFPTLEEQGIDPLLSELRALLKAAFAQAHQEQPDKKSYRLNLH